MLLEEQIVKVTDYYADWVVLILQQSLNHCNHVAKSRTQLKSLLACLITEYILVRGNLLSRAQFRGH